MVSHFFSWQKFPEGMWPHFAAEFYDSGARFVVLTHHWALRLSAEPEFARTLSALMKGSGLRFAGAHAPFGPAWDLNSAPPENLKKHAEILKQCAGFGIENCTFHVGEFPAGVSREEARNHALRSLEFLVSAAAPLGIVIAAENAEHPGGSLEELRFLRRGMPGPEVGFCYDSGHANLNGGALAVLEGLLPDLVTCHLHDNDGRSDWHWPPGRGNVPWPQVAAGLRRAPRLCLLQNEVNALDSGTSIVRLCGIFAKLDGETKNA